MGLFDSLFGNNNSSGAVSAGASQSATAAGSGGASGTTTGLSAAGMAGGVLSTGGWITPTIGGTTYQGSSGTLTIPSTSPYITATGITLGTQLTTEEQKELSELKAQWELERKTNKLIEFKKLPTELRQFVVTSLQWQNSVTSINSAVTDKSTRLQELEAKEAYGRLFGGSISFQWQQAMSAQVILPEGLTIEDLIEAHSQQSMEEELLNGE